MTSDIEIVRWTRPELPAGLDALVAEAVADGHAWAGDFPPEWARRPLTGEGEALLIARADAEPLAMAVLSADIFLADGETGRLRYIYVRESARRRGLAERFVRECLSRAEGRWRRLRLHTDNPRAAALYERHGFRPSGDDPRATHVRDP